MDGLTRQFIKFLKCNQVYKASNGSIGGTITLDSIYGSAPIKKKLEH
jgi:hypothetical protein